MNWLTTLIADLKDAADYLHHHHLKRPVRRALIALGAVLVVGTGVAVGLHLHGQQQATQAAAEAAQAKQAQQAAQAAKQARSQRQAAAKAAAAKKAAAKKAVAIDWHKPSEAKAYPNVYAYAHLAIQVSLAKQRVYIKNGATVLYTMYASTGMNDTTPHGTYAIQRERGDYFYNPNEKMGAHYYTSFLNHGQYLFHTVPTDANRQYIPAEAAKLGKEPASHGCVRLSIPDAQWIMNTVPEGTPVTIG
ncbi:L,D-transpeptidase [Lacticaseibacillus absianus]|uniref:L,D-transpeptidase n=1 Tax=Lacticaseibacillus absianus TaxID=2729623 RepID=UPI001C5363E8